MSASSSTTAADFPPSSSATRLTVFAAISDTRLPAAVEPVNDTISTWGCDTIASPTTGPNPVTRLKTPAGLPAGVFNLVTGFGPVVGEAMVSHPQVDMVSFTGSTAAGKRVSEIAAKTVKRVALELGGKSAAVVLDDADMAVAVKGVVTNCYLNSGQTCTAHTRMLVPESRYGEAAKIAAEVAKAFKVGDPMADGTTLGPLASAV